MGCCISLIRVFFFVFFSCALTVNVIGLLFLRQCFVLLPPSTETLINGMSRKLPLWNLVSQYVYRRMTWRELMLLRLEGSVGTLELVVMMWCKDGREVAMKNTGDWVFSYGLLWSIVTTYAVCDDGDSLMRFPRDMSCILAAVRVPYEILCFLAA